MRSILLITFILILTACEEKVEMTEMVFEENIFHDQKTKSTSVKSFKNSLYKVTRKQCIACHTSQYPEHASDSIELAHDQLVMGEKVNFTEPTESVIYKKVLSGHNCWTNNCKEDAETILVAVKSWASQLNGVGIIEPTPEPTTASGAALYNTNCKSCHGALGNSTKINTSVSQIKAGIKDIKQMNYLNKILTDLEISLIASALEKNDNAAPSPSPSPKDYSCNKSLKGNIENGKNYYHAKGDTFTINCTTCHSGDGIKREYTCEELKKAFDIPAMSSLVYPTEQQFADMEAYLNNFTNNNAPIPTERTPSGDFEISVAHNVPTATRKLLKSKLNAIFNTPKYSGSINNIINARITNQPSFFGGTCAYRQESCGGSDLEGANTQMLPTTNEPRRGYITRTCKELTARDDALNNLVAKFSFSLGDTPTQVRIEEMLDIFYPGIVVSKQTKSSLLKIYTAAKEKGLSNKESWRYISMTLCMSPTLEIL